jgi:predicted GNAT family N-acyltransferase
LKTLELFLLPWDQASSSSYPIRQQVFIDEQKVPEELELDEFDPLAIHALAYLGEQCVGTARLVDLGNGHPQVGRMAVLANFRGRGIGKQILAKLVQTAKEEGFFSVVLHSQVSAIPFYEKQGFIAQGPIYDEAGIAHRNMMLILPNSTK